MICSPMEPTQTHPRAILEKIQEWKGMGENLLNSLVDSFSDIESREQAATESLDKRKKDLEDREKKFELYEEEKRGKLTLQEEKLDDQLKLVREHIERLEASQGFWNREKSKEFDELYNRKLREIGLKEEVLSNKEKQFGHEVKLVNEELRKKQRIGWDLIEKLESALKLMAKMKVGLDERFKEMEAWEAAAHKNLTAKLNEADLIEQSLHKRFKDLDKMEQEFSLFRDQKTGQLESKERHLEAMRIQLLKDIKLKEEKLSFLEHMIAEKLNKIESFPEEDAPESKQHELQDKLEMLINTSDKDLDLMDDEIFELLLQSSDPPKFVLDAVDGLLYTSKSNLGQGCEEELIRLRRVCILMLEQLTKMSPDIEPCVRGEAIRLAVKWMSNLNTTAAEYPLEVLMLLHLLAAYNLSSNFDNNEIFSFAKLVVQHKHTPKLCRILGLADKVPDIIQNLLREKQYLLASTYICEFGLNDTFPQSAVLDFYVKHAKLSARDKCRREEKPFEAQAEIADLRVAIGHIIKYGLEAECSLEVITERIKQLERNEAILKCASPPSSSSGELGKGKKSWDLQQQKQHDEGRSCSSWKAAQNWRRRKRNGRPSTSPVGFRKHEVPMTHLTPSQKRSRFKN